MAPIPSIAEIQQLLTVSSTAKTPSVSFLFGNSTERKLTELGVNIAQPGAGFVPKTKLDLTKRANELLDTRFARLERLRQERTDADNRSAAYSTLVNELKELQTQADKLRSDKKFERYITRKESVTELQIVNEEVNATEEISIDRIFNNKLRLTGASNLQTGTEIKFTSGIPGSDIVAGQSYYLRRVDDTAADFRVFTTKEKALDGTKVGREAVFFDQNQVSAKLARDIRKTVSREISQTVSKDVQQRDADTARNAVQDFVKQFNRIQSLIETLTGMPAGSSGNSFSGALAGDSLLQGIKSNLRSAFLPAVNDLSDSYKSSGKSKEVSIDIDKLDAKTIDRFAHAFLKAGNGIADRVTEVVSAATAGGGPLLSRISSVDAQKTRLASQITRFETKAEQERENVQRQLDAAAKAINQTNDHVRFLSNLGVLGQTIPPHSTFAKS